MIGIINMPPESPADYYDHRPLRNGETIVFPERKRSATPVRFFAPDGQPHGVQFQQAQSADSLWEDTLQRSLVYRLGVNESRKRSVSCDNVDALTENIEANKRISKEAEDTIVRAPSRRSKIVITTPSQLKSRDHRKSSSPLARASAFFSKSLPKITQLK